MKLVKFLRDSSLLIKNVTKNIKSEPKEKQSGFLNMLLGSLGASLSRNLLTGKGIIRAGERMIAMSWGYKANIHGRGTITPGQDF